MSASPKIQKDQHKSHEILTGCSAIVIGFCETHCDNFVVEASQALFEQAKAVQDNKQQQVFFETSHYLESNTSDLRRYFEQAVKKRFSDAYSGKPFDAGNPSADDDNELSLVNNNEMEIDIAIKGMVHRIDTSSTQALYCLTQRMAMLNQGIKIEDHATPYSAQFLSQVFYDFICRVDLDLTNQLLLLKLFERSFIAKLPDLYREMNNYLVSSNVLPNLRFGKRSTDHQPRRRKTDQHAAQSEERQHKLYDTLASFFNGPAAPIDAAQPMMNIEQALSELIGTQKPVEDILAQRSQEMLPNTNNSSLQTTLDCVALLFDMVDQQRSLGSPIKDMFSHLRTPYARIALTDPSFFANPQHQARQLIQSMLSASERWTDQETSPTHELIQKIKLIIEQVITDASKKQQDPAILGALLQEFNQYIDSFERKIELTEKRSVQAAQGREKLKENQLTVELFIAQRTKGLDLPKPIAELISDTWASYMTYLLLRFGIDSEQWQTATSAIDSVIWYIEPKLSDEENKKADEIRENLQEVLTGGMEQVGLTAGDIKAKLKNLDLCRQLATENASELLKNTPPESPVENVDSQPTTPIDETDQLSIPAQNASPRKTAIEQQRERLRDKNAVNKASNKDQHEALTEPTEEIHEAPAQNEELLFEKHLRTPDNESTEVDSIEAFSETHIESISNTPTKTVSDAQIEAVLNLKFGTWLDWRQQDDSIRRLKLTWFNRKTNNCMISNKAGQEVGIFSAKTIAQGLESGDIQVVNEVKKTPIFEKMLEKFSKKKVMQG